MPLRIEDYALIGDCETAALVGRDGSIDWLCWPRFNSGACFAALLGGPEHGHWSVAPAAADARATRRYLPGTLVLETVFTTSTGSVAVIEFMPPRSGVSDLVRLVVGRRGRVAMHTTLILRFDYGSAVPWVSRLEDGALRAVAGPDMAILHTPVAVHGEGLTTQGDFSVAEGETVPFVLSYVASHLAAPSPIDPMRALADTEAFWVEWSSRGGAAGPWTEAVQRSLITLKALTYSPTGGIVAAPTTSLPEHPGGQRNWDYRFCWLRDATLTLLALMNAGYLDEARSWRDWLLRAAAGSPSQLQIMYGLGGERRLTEWEVPWLPGYEGSRPVRIGNGAHGQLQLDVYGEMMDALHQGRGLGMAGDGRGWALACALLGHLEQDLAPAGRGHLGDARPAPALHLLQGDGLGGIRPRGAERRGMAAGRASRRMAPTARRDPRRGLRPRLRRGTRLVRAGLWLAAARRQPAATVGRWASCRPTTRASSAPWPPSSGG